MNTREMMNEILSSFYTKKIEITDDKKVGKNNENINN